VNRSPYVIGIDLGTTNCVLAYVDTREDEGSSPAPIQVLDIPQLVAPGEVGKKALLPSFIYLPTDAEKENGQLQLPWDPFGERVVGTYAQTRGAEVPGRLVASAKSWLCHQRIDRTAALLPLDAPPDVAKLSPIVASATLLRHLKAAWNQGIGKGAGERMEEQDVYLTIPASFDAVARELTVQAARSAGLDNIVLLEEPQAAFYAWLHAHRDDWKELIAPGDMVLVCDVGGGTTDFSLIRVVSRDNELGLDRVAVGDHILLGGDNMDLALAHVLSEELKARGTKLDRLQMLTLWHNVRLAKERLLASQDLNEAPVVIPGRGSGIVGGTVRTALTLKQVEALLLDGFFPVCGSMERPQEAARIGLQEFGLPYVSDTGITRHLAKFLGTQGGSQETGDARPRGPSVILFNGGVLKGRILQKRIVETLDLWLDEAGSPPVRELLNADLDTAVARGAAYYGLVLRGEGIKIRGGIPRSHYIGIEKVGPAIPGIPPSIKALCLVPKGMEEGSSISLPDMTFGLVVGQPVEFRFMAANNRPDDAPGHLVEDWEGTIEPISTVEATIEAPELRPGAVVPVQLQAEVTEIGTLALSLVSAESDLRFELQFNVRGDGA